MPGRMRQRAHGLGAALAGKALRTRWLVRAPIWLYRAGLGGLLGGRVLMLQHVGRRSGANRYVVLEVIDRPGPRSYVVVSGFGTSAQWFRNLEVTPSVRVWVGRVRGCPAAATIHDPDASARTLRRYAQEHPRAWRNLRSIIEQATGAPVSTMPTVALELRR